MPYAMTPTSYRAIQEFAAAPAYATASARSDGLLLLCGGRDANSVFFVNARLHVSGGALGGGRMVEDSSSVAGFCSWSMCDTKSAVTSPMTGRYSADVAGGDAAVELTRRCRHAAAAVGDLVFIYGGSLSKGVEYLVEAAAAEAEAISATMASAKARQVNGEVELPDRDRGAEATPSGKQIPMLTKPDSAVSNNFTPAGVRLHHRAVIVAAETGGALGGMVRQLSIDQLENEGRRVSYVHWLVHVGLPSIEMVDGNGPLPLVSRHLRDINMQHFVNARLHVSGGALGGGRMVEDSSSVAVLDTAAGVWCDTKSVVTGPRTGRYSADAAGGDAAVELTRCCRHAAAAVGDLVFIYGVSLSKGVEYLVEAAAAEAEAISATMAAAKARQVNGEVELPDRDRGAEATPTPKRKTNTNVDQT
ncbi:hypothetical protein OROGR_022194 [Orobanche gracilis]